MPKDPLNDLPPDPNVFRPYYPVTKREVRCTLGRQHRVEVELAEVLRALGVPDASGITITAQVGQVPDNGVTLAGYAEICHLWKEGKLVVTWETFEDVPHMAYSSETGNG